MTTPKQSQDASPESRSDCSVAVKGVSHRHVAVSEVVEWQLPEEEPTALVYNGRSFAVMLASPADLEDFGLGFSLAEGVVESAAEVDDIEVLRLEAGLAIRMTIPNIRAAALMGRGRAMEGRSGCGICGIETLEALRRPLKQVRRPDVAPDAIAWAFQQLNDHQPMRARNFSVHGAAWCDRLGQVLLSREDVGRHTALDKLIGAMSQAGVDNNDGFVVMSSRCGFELVQKAANVGIGLLASVSAPTTMALSMARQVGMSLAVSAKANAVVVLE
ncbi:formate dehydrogenase accessory sulfurtransferase FdhD [Magnetospirillum sp. 64-120]|uniref:formate dehydrogenase accessory sulfurtransferase FdhD n=1 Tax=Magnetospirillum sp. 64-120 TaxID=1895778 RepID=UPI000A67A82E|nr:formate dehydrogenase accessory sulfurtransferase FdhD [Magnetospirillum sp. 64-120]